MLKIKVHLLFNVPVLHNATFVSILLNSQANFMPGLVTTCKMC